MIGRIKEQLGKLLLIISPEIYKKVFYKNLITLSWPKVFNEKKNPELLYLNYFLKPDDVFFDVGSNRGEFVFGASKTLSPENIYAFEPIPFLNQKLKKLFKQSHILNIALSDSTGKARFKIPVIKGKKYDTRGTLNMHFKEDEESRSVEFDVDIQTLDQFVEGNGIEKVDFIKIDVEGLEEKVMRGASKSVEKFRPTLLVEIEQRHHAKPIKEIIFDFTARHKYACYYFHLESKSFVELPENADLNKVQNVKFFKSHPALYINNFFFIPSEGIKEGFMTLVDSKLQKDIEV